MAGKTKHTKTEKDDIKAGNDKNMFDNKIKKKRDGEKDTKWHHKGLNEE